jgi:co-chaperonin GroES (HSP10)
MDVRLLHDRIIVRRLVDGEQKSGAIIIPDSAKEKPLRGEVLAAGTVGASDDVERRRRARRHPAACCVAVRKGRRLADRIGK